MLHAAYTALRRNSQSETRKRLGGKHKRYTESEIGGFVRRAAKLNYAALVIISDIQEGTVAPMDREEILRHLEQVCPGFAEETYRHAYSDTMQDLR